MRVTSLKVTNLRAIDTAEFGFQPGFNLIVGVNGVGKTSVLDALGVCLSAITRHANRLRIPANSFSINDIRIGTDALTVECGIKIGDAKHVFLIHEPRETSGSQEKQAGMPREQVHDTPRKAEFVGAAPKSAIDGEAGGRPLAVLFSTRRAQPSERAPSKGVAAGGIPAAYADAFANRELRLNEFAAWMRVQMALKAERPEAMRVLDAFEHAVSRFLPGYSNLRVEGDDKPKLLIDHGETTTLAIESLSDTEQAQLAMALEWTEDRMALDWAKTKLAPDATEEDEKRAYSDAKAKVLKGALGRFLPGCTNLRADRKGRDNRLIDRKPTTLEIGQLSDGERGILAIVLDLTRRLAQANPELDRPTEEAEAVVLIDEIDLHLHPKWQRQIVQNLTVAFPKCQFIATTHSPQVIGEVEHDRIQIIAQGQVYSPMHSFGVDSSRVLEEVMEAGPRTEAVQELLARLSRAIGDEEYENARTLLNELVTKIGEDDPEVTRVRTLLDFMDGEE
jgi:hypothetical protein